MKKYLWKIAPYECFEVDAIAGWLDEMSQNGLQFRDKWGPFCRFERSPSPARYRVDPVRVQLDPTEEERIAAYREFGWEYCSPYTHLADVYRAEDPDTVELHTDRELLGGLVKRSIRGQFGLCLHFAVVLFFLYVPDGFYWFSQTYDPDYLPITLFLFSFVLTLVLSIALTFFSWRLLKKHPEAAVHTPQRLRRGTFWRTIRLMLLTLCTLGFLFCLFQLIFLL